ncbi:MAG: type 4a pilus biogenesis protein PilO [Halanaerobiales bacterium]|nr:type 4a pilus biogenesis protein PilO [Halanaerobiales bacterium]
MLNNLTKREKWIILIAMIVLITGIYYFQFYQPLKAEKVSLESQMKTLNTQYNQTLSMIKKKMPEVQESVADKQEQYQRILEKFPRQKETSAILLEIVELADQEDIQLENFTPKNMKSIGEFYQLPIDLSFKSTYQAMIGFIYSLERSLKVMEITDLDVKAFSEKDLLQISLTLQMYIVKEEK